LSLAKRASLGKTSLARLPSFLVIASLTSSKRSSHVDAFEERWQASCIFLGFACVLSPLSCGTRGVPDRSRFSYKREFPVETLIRANEADAKVGAGAEGPLRASQAGCSLSTCDCKARLARPRSVSDLWI